MALLDYFKPVANDQSIIYLGNLFGGLSTLPGTPGILATLFKLFNTIVLVVGLFVIVYVVIVGLLTTAHEGEFLAKKFHGLWTPLRMVIGIMALVPTPIGYSGLQVIIMWVFIQGIGAADTLWTTALAYVQQNGFYGSMTDTPATTEYGVNTYMQKFLGGLTCVASINLPKDLLVQGVKDNWTHKNNFTGYLGSLVDNQGNSTIEPPVVSKSCSGDTCQLTLPYNCGILTYANPKAPNLTDDTKNINKAQQDVLIGSNNADAPTITLNINNTQTILDKLYYLASFFAHADQDYLNFYYQSSIDPENESKVNIGNSAGGDWGWISNYCTMKDVSITPCCVKGTACLPPYANQAKFFAPSSASDTPTDASSDAARNIYFVGNIKRNIPLSPVFANIKTKEGAKLEDIDKPADFYQAIINYINETYVSAIQSVLPPPKEIQDTDLSEASKRGWITAGAYYYYISTFSDTKSQSANPVFTFNIPNLALLISYRNNISVTAQMFTDASSDPTTGQYAGVADNLKQSTLRGFMTNLTGGTTAVNVNPLVKLHTFGKSLLGGAEATYPIVIALDIAVAILATVTSIQYFGTGPGQGLFPILSTIHAFFTPILLSLIAVLAAIGGLLAVYLPLVPYIIFTMTALGWFISIIEAMVASPLIAIGILSPSAQHHEVLGKADQALMTVFSIFLKPSLIIFGLIVAMLLASIGVSLINMTFEQLVLSVTATTAIDGAKTANENIGFLELLFYMSAYLFLIVSVLNKCFSVIAILPGKVMTYIGGQAEGGEVEALGEVKGGIAGAGGKAAGGAAQGVQSRKKASKAHDDAVERRDKFKKEENEPGKSKVNTEGEKPPGDGKGDDGSGGFKQ